MRQQDPPPILIYYEENLGLQGTQVNNFEHILFAGACQWTITGNSRMYQSPGHSFWTTRIKESQNKGHVRYAIIMSWNVMTPPLAESENTSVHINPCLLFPPLLKKAWAWIVPQNQALAWINPQSSSSERGWSRSKVGSSLASLGNGTWSRDVA
jgi:hypothetical protein